MDLDLGCRERVAEKSLPEEEQKEEKKYPLKLNSYKWSNLKAWIKVAIF